MATRRRASRSSLTGTIGDVRRRLRYLEGRPSPSKLANQVVRRTNIQPRSVATDQIALGAITNSLVDENAIAQAQLQDNSVGQDEIIEDSVGNSELQNDAVDSPNILEDAVGNSEIDVDAVENENVANDAIGNNELQNDAVDSPEIVTDAVDSDEIAPEAVGESELGLDSVGNNELQNDSVDSVNVLNDAIEDRHIVEMSSSKLKGLIESSQIKELEAAKITFGILDVARIPNLPASKITSGTLNINRIPDLPASQITSGTFGTARIADESITNAKISNSSPISGAKILNESITYGKIADTTPGLIVNRGAATGNVYLSSEFSDRSFIWRVYANVGTTSNTLAVGSHSHGGSSSVKIKKDITDHEIDPQKLLNLKLKKFKYKNKNRDIHEGWNREWLHGYLVEDVMELGLEEVITYDHHGDPETIRYDMIGVLSIELIKQQQNEIESLKEEIKRLKDSL